MISSFIDRYLLPIVFGAGLVVGVTLVGVGGHYWQAWFHDPAVRKEALKGYVAEAQYTAAVARAEKAERDSIIAKNASENYRRQAEADALADQAREAIEQQATGDYEARRKAAGKFDPMMEEDWNFIEGKQQ